MNGSVSTSPAAPVPRIRPSDRGQGGTAGWASLRAMNTDPTVLLTPPGQRLLTRLAAEADGGGTALALAVWLRREYPAVLVAAASAQHYPT